MEHEEEKEQLRLKIKALSKLIFDDLHEVLIGHHNMENNPTVLNNAVMSALTRISANVVAIMANSNSIDPEEMKNDFINQFNTHYENYKVSPMVTDDVMKLAKNVNSIDEFQALVKERHPELFNQISEYVKKIRR